MSGAPTDDPNADTRGWFVPPPTQPSDLDITYAGPLPSLAPPLRGRRIPPQDRQVWPPPPPPPEDDEGYSTQPFPIIAAPLPAAARPAAPPPAEESAEPARPERAPRPLRLVLLVIALVVAVALALAAPGWFAYGVYKERRPDDKLHTVPAGQPGTFQHVAWTAAIEPMDDPSGAGTATDRQWLKIVLTRTAVDAEGAIRHGSPAEVTLRDGEGRSWRTEELSNETPATLEENRVGQAYKIEMVGVVPAQVADEVEVYLRPSTYRDVPEQSVQAILKKSIESGETLENVLRFLR